MALIEVNYHPNKKDLTVFSFGGCAILGVAALAMHLKGHPTGAAILIGVGVVLIVGRLASLKVTRVLYLGLVFATLPIGWTIGTVLMLLFYYGLLMPIGLVFRLIGRDSLCRKWDPTAQTYWVEHKPAQKKERYFQQF
jgi:hypothetical protein